MAGWMTQFAVQDAFLVRSDREHFHLLVSGYHGLMWIKMVDLVGFSRGRPFYEADFVDRSDPFETVDIEWRWKALGFDFGQGHHAFQAPFGFWIIPYWSIAIPLTLISVWLVGSKATVPRPELA